MALIGMAIFSTEENKKDVCLEKTLKSLKETVNFSKHRLIISINAATKKTEDLILEYSEILEGVIINDTNIGTAEAINKVWRHRREGENAIKMDDDIVIYHNGWIDEMEAAIKRDSSIGQCGLKRKDCIETVDNPTEWYKSTLRQLLHEGGQTWIIVEECHHIMGSCVMHSDALLNKIGYLKQPDLYGFDDAFMSIRSSLAGFKNVFLSHINIDHVDEGSTPYQKWKENHASECWSDYHKTIAGFKDGSISLYYNPFKK